MIRYRDFPIEDLFRDYVYEDVMHLVIWGQIPTLKQKEEARVFLSDAAIPPKSVVDVISAFPFVLPFNTGSWPKIADEHRCRRDSDSCPMIIAGLSAFAASDKMVSASHRQQTPMFHGHLEVADQALIRTLGYIASTIALIHCHKRDKAFTNPESGRSLIGNLLLMMGMTDPKVEKCLNKLWILYADHEMTNSTAAVLHAASTLTDPVSAAISEIRVWTFARRGD